MGRWAFKNLTSLAAQRPEWAFEILWIEDRQRPPRDGLPPNVSVRVLRFPGKLQRWALTAGGWPAAERFSGPADVFLGPAFVTWPTRAAVSIPVIHDLTYLKHPSSMAVRNRIYLRSNMPRVVRRATRIVTVSESVKEQVAAHYGVEPQRICVVPNGVEAPAAGPQPAPHALPDRYFLAVGTLEPRKNIRVLVDAHARLRRRRPDSPKLALVGGQGWGQGQWGADLSEAERLGDVVRLGFVDDDHLWSVYRGAVALVFPSLYEGFGLPVLEAMSVGCPVVAGPTGAIPELGRDAVLLIDQKDPAAVSAAMEKVMDEEDLRQRLSASGRRIASGYTWSRSGELLAHCIERAVTDPAK